MCLQFLFFYKCLLIYLFLNVNVFQFDTYVLDFETNGRNLKWIYNKFTDISYNTGKLMGNWVGEGMGRKVDEKSHHIIFGSSEDRGTTNSFG